MPYARAEDTRPITVTYVPVPVPWLMVLAPLVAGTLLFATSK